MRWRWTARRQEPALDQTGPATAYPDRTGAHPPADGPQPPWDEPTSILPLTTLGEQRRGHGGTRP